MSVKISELSLLSDLADNDVLAGVDTSANATKKIELATLKDYIDTNTTYTAGTNIDITNNVVSAPNVYNKDEMDSQIEELQSEVDSLNTIYNAFPTVSDEDESMTLDGTAETKFKRIDLKGNTSQTGTPTPSSPIPVNVVSGDNSVNIQNKNLWASVWEQGTINSSGDNDTSSSCIRTKDYIPVIPNQHYAINRSIYTSYINVRCYDSNKNYLGAGSSYINLISGTSSSNPMGDGTDRCVISPKDNVYYIRINDFTNNLSTQYMMVKGDTQVYYEPFSIDTYPINLPVENLLQTDTIDFGATTNNLTLAHSINANNYILSGANITATSGAFVLYGIDENNTQDTLLANKNWANISDGYSFTTTKKYVSMKMYSNVAVRGNLQLELGSKANSYTPYGTTPIELCKIGDYQDYFLKENDKWYKVGMVGKLVLDENSGLTSATSNTFKVPNSLTTNIVRPLSSASLLAIFSNYLKPISWDSNWTNQTGFISMLHTGSTDTRIKVYGTETLAELNTWLSTHNIFIYYECITPTNTEITYQPLIEQLNAIEKAMSYEGQTNISQVNNDLPFIINAEAILSLQNVLDRVTLLES